MTAIDRPAAPLPGAAKVAVRSTRRSHRLPPWETSGLAQSGRNYRSGGTRSNAPSEDTDSQLPAVVLHPRLESHSPIQAAGHPPIEKKHTEAARNGTPS